MQRVLPFLQQWDDALGELGKRQDTVAIFVRGGHDLGNLLMHVCMCECVSVCVCARARACVRVHFLEGAVAR